VRGQGELAHPEERRASRVAQRSHTEHTVVLALGRVIFGGYFLYNGIQHFLDRQAYSDYARSKDVPAADAAVLGSGALILLGGLSLLTGVGRSGVRR
jgi:uncharacterized membrane protein YphA (DoxX/SURF4 family)